MNRYLPTLALFATVVVQSALCAADSGPKSAPSAIRQDSEAVRILAGVLEKRIRLSGGNVITESLLVAGAPLLDSKSAEMSFQISRATPNRNPLELLSGSDAAGIRVAETMTHGTDATNIQQERKQETGTSPAVNWTEGRSFSSGSWQDCFGQSNITPYDPAPGIHRLLIRTRSINDPVLADVSIHQIYETYDGYPVIRKWVEIHNNSANWLKLENLVIDALRIAPEYSRKTALTPSERGATASLLAFSTTDQTRGVIVASEVPSALRQIRETGDCGYNPEHFEWVLGPAESFVSEPTFLYAFAGEVRKTPSAESCPLDRAVEGRFKEFLHEHLNISPRHLRVPAPQWATWSNFGPQITDAIVREQADIAAKCSFALFEIDDGWQKDRLGTTPNPRTFPDFNATCDYVRGTGMRVGLWVSSFRGRAAADFKALPGAASAPEVRRLDGVAMAFASDWHNYYAHNLIRLRDAYGATYFKQDFTNLKFGDLAPTHTSRTRKESLLRGLRGLLASQAVLRRLAPDVANQLSHEIYWGTPGVPCDLAALKQVAFFHIPPNDYSGACLPGKNDRPGASAGWNQLSPEDMRARLLRGCLNARTRFYEHRGLPLECLEYYSAGTVNWKGSLTPQVQDRQVCSWLMGAPLVYSGDLASLTPANIQQYHRRFDLLKRLESQYGIYRCFQFSGVPVPTDTDWHWWGKLNREGCGAVVVLRGSQGQDQRAINIPWVDPDKEYKVTALFQEKALGTFTGRQLHSGALTLALPPLGQDILEFLATQQPSGAGK